ncbi:MAG: SpoIIE family protein phosphatase, partial [Proteobacteria bacterium]|nr:SpoIIE family protein phosphatase [Pseudomonadota bacterium]
RSNLNRQYQSSLIDSTQLLGEKIYNLLTRWDNRLSYLVQIIWQNRPQERRSIVESFLASEEGIKGLWIMQLKNSGPIELIKNIKIPSADQNLDFFVKAMKSREVFLLQHPSLAKHGFLIRRIKIRGNEPDVLVAVLFDFKAFPIQKLQENKLKIYLLDLDFKDLVKGKKYQDLIDDKKFAKKAQNVMRGDIGAGYLGESQQGKSNYFVAYHHLPTYPLLLVVHQDSSPIDLAVREFLLEMLRWTVFFVLLAIYSASTITRNLLSNLRELSLATLEIAAGNLENTIEVRSDDEIGQLSASFNVMTRKIVDLLATEHERARMDQELSTAQTVQNTFFQENIIQKSQFILTGYNQSASECGGDWWGHFSLNDGKELVVIADATGHGVPAALITAIAYASTHTLASQIKQGAFPENDPAAILHALNELLYKTLKGKLCMSFIAMIIDVPMGSMRFSNAGHPFPILIPQEPSDERLGQTKKNLASRFLIQKKKSSNILGIDGTSVFYNENFNMRAGDKLILYTDGLMEAENTKGKQLGGKGIQNIIQKNLKADGKMLRDSIIQEATEFNAKAQVFDDDVTLVIIEYRSREELAA